MKAVVKRYICIVCLTLPTISNAAQGFCGAGLIKKLVEGYQGTNNMMIYLEPTEGISSMQLKLILSNARSNALSKTLRIAMSAHLPVRVYQELNQRNMLVSCDNINEVRICYTPTDCL